MNFPKGEHELYMNFPNVEDYKAALLAFPSYVPKRHQLDFGVKMIYKPIHFFVIFRYVSLIRLLW